MSTVPPPLQISHASGLHAVSRTLENMHREMLRLSGNEGAAVRLAVVNLVAACTEVEGADVATQAVGRLGARHPARAIVIVAQPEEPAQIEADLSLQCAVVSDGQLCAEQVRLLVGGEAAYHLASLVTPLLVPDVPVYLWLIGSPPLRQAFGQDAIAVCERLIIDSGAYHDVAATLALLSSQLKAVGSAIALVDVSWESIRPWRRLIAQAFDGEEVRSFLRAVRSVEIESSGDQRSAQAWLLGGWMASRLEPLVGEALQVQVGTREADDVPEGDLVMVRILCAEATHQATVSLHRQGETLHTVIDVDDGIRAERSVPGSPLDTTDVVSSLLENEGEDPVYRGALARAAELARRPA